ncbi:MAG: hypothetical protein GWN31_05900, partial [Candidatus Thorarchaeota archaeon]|nr:hypothetical protein [Candidatus Thorarchaeota archaeon]NIW13460.1 hypothetical protein [Candidatus Thorarchaeota archaeon]NIW51570.1 hypothetical protein [Candidatus Korarchaeota archaeon]
MSRDSDEDYEHLYEALELMWEEEYYPESLLELKNMMKGYGFLNASTKKGVKRQIDTAWRHLKGVAPS